MRKLIGTILISVAFVAIPAFVDAAQLRFDIPDDEIYEGDVFRVNIMLDSKEKAINAAQVDLDFSKETLDIVSAEKGKSILKLWINEPAYSNALALASFIGGLPDPGFKDNDGLVGFIHFKAKQTGPASLSFRESTTRVLLNDGMGTEVEINLQSAFFNVLAAPEGRVPRDREIEEDNIPPEPFKPRITRDDNAFDGKYFVIFETEDLQTGVSHYDLQEEKDGEPGPLKINVVSPHILDSQEGHIKVTVSAYDYAGNVRKGVAEMDTEGINLIPGIVFILGLVLLYLLAVYFVFKYIRDRKNIVQFIEITDDRDKEGKRKN